MRKITADKIFPVAQAPIEKGVIVLDDAGKIIDITERSAHDLSSLEMYSGVLIPGFINTHCHLELSHMKGVAPTGVGLLPFLQTVVKYRNVSEEAIQEAIINADREMWNNGIVAVGDICNKSDTKITKDNSPIRYYSFVEMFDFLQDANAENTFQHYKAVFDEQSDLNGNRKSMVPHAPYTVSKSLFQQINEANRQGVTVSIHNQETVHENDFFLTKTGGFLDFYKDFNIPIDAFAPTKKTSIHYALQHMDATQRTLFVHNTMTTVEDIQAAQAWNKQVYWATCPNANLYIENRLPNYRYFLDTNAHLTIGTDSLTSNWQLCILDEMTTIKKYQSYLPFDTILQWATLNGASALGFENDLGSLEIGKQPGINLLSDTNLNAQTTVKRLI